MTKDSITLLRYVPYGACFEEITRMPNAVLDEINKFKSVESKKEYAKRMLAGIADMIEYAIKDIDEQEEDFDKPVEGQISIEIAEGARK